MTRNISQTRKIAYLIAIALLLYPLYELSRPAVAPRERSIDPGKATSTEGGGVLATMRRKYNLEGASLGEIDPTGATLKLATLGLKNVAANYLWEKANYYKKTEDWDSFMATLQQLKLIQPNYISVIEFQSHNVSYNVSVEFDDYRLRYHWVKKGLNFLIDGTRYNRNDPKLLWYLGWIFSQKIGRADEVVQFRREFRKDTDWHHELEGYLEEFNSHEEPNALDYKGRPDNWKVGLLWYLRAQNAVDHLGKPLRGQSPLVFHSHPPMALVYHSIGLDNEGDFGPATEAWKKAGAMLNVYGNRDIPTSYGYYIRLNEEETLRAEAKKALDELEKLVPAGTKERIRAERLAKLTAGKREALHTPAQKRTIEQVNLAAAAEQELVVEPRDLAAALPADKRGEARRLAAKAFLNETYAETIDRYRNIVNFAYWRTRCEMEQSPTAERAHRYLSEATDAYKYGNLAQVKGSTRKGAKEYFELAWDEWAKIFAKYPELLEDITADELVDKVIVYRDLLGQIDEEFPRHFKLQNLIDKHPKKFQELPAGQKSPAKKDAKAGDAETKAAEPGDAEPAEKKADEATPKSAGAPEKKAEQPTEPEAKPPAGEKPAGETPAAAPAEKTEAQPAAPPAEPATEKPAEPAPAK